MKTHLTDDFQRNGSSTRVSGQRGQRTDVAESGQGGYRLRQQRVRVAFVRQLTRRGGLLNKGIGENRARKSDDKIKGLSSQRNMIDVRPYTSSVRCIGGR